MKIKEIIVPPEKALALAAFKEMDYFAVEHYGLPIELMMENAGLQLAKLVAHSIKDSSAKILIGIGNGNNGGGGLVTARRLAAWVYDVYLDIFTKIDKDLPKKQLERALKFEVKQEVILDPSVWIDAYLGFSQRLPLNENLTTKLEQANKCDCLRVSLDIPTGFLGDTKQTYFQANMVLSLAAPKILLYQLPLTSQLFIADLGIPKAVYNKFNSVMPPFYQNTILKIKR